MLNRRSFFQAAGATAVAAAIPTVEAAQKASVTNAVAENVAKTFRVVLSRVPSSSPRPKWHFRPRLILANPS